MCSAMNNFARAAEVLGPDGGGEFAIVGERVGVTANHPATIVLQPCSALTQENSQAFQRSLEEALDLAGESVIVDLLWVETTDLEGITALVMGVEKAACLGKSISFQSMRHHTRVAMEVEWDRQRRLRLGEWRDRCEPNLAQFLGENKKA